MTSISSPEANLSATVRQRWEGGAVVDFSLRANVPVGDWEVEVDAGGEIVNIWNAVVVRSDGTRYVLRAQTYNRLVAEGTEIDFGFEMEGDGPVFLYDVAAESSAVLAAQTAREPRPAAPPDEREAPSRDADPDGAPVQHEAPTPGERETAPPVPGRGEAAASPDAGGAADAAEGVAPRDLSSAYAAQEPARAVPLEAPRERLSGSDFSLKDRSAGGVPPASTLMVEPVTAQEPAGAPPSPQPFAAGPLSTRGAAIVDGTGEPVALRGLNWFGLETDIFVPHGLWARNWRDIMDDVKALGFNTMRMPFSGELVSSGGGRASGIDYGLNPDLEGLDGLGVLDMVVGYADTIGLRIILDYHRGPVGGGPNENGLWYGNGRSEGDVIAEWEAMARRYGESPAVIGADLINEPFMATWGDGTATDWAAAAERIGGAIQAIAPQWLILVEGVSVYEGDPYWWGGNLQGVAERPVRLPVPDKLVYAPHDYPASIHPQDWFFDGSDLTDKFRQNWGYIAEEGIAPVLVGEWGSRLETAQDRRWADALAHYMAQNGMSWLWWSLNPNSGDTGGIFEDDWATVRQPILDLLDPFLDPPDAPSGPSARFSVDLGAPADSDVTVKYATTDGTATAGEDYRAVAGVLTIAAGEREGEVAVPLLPDARSEGNEYFYLVLSTDGAVRASTTALIADARERRAGQTPFLDVANTVVVEGADAAVFRLVLSETVGYDIAVDYTTRADTHNAGDLEGLDGRITVPAGASDALIEVPVGDDERPEGAKRFTLEITAADGALIRDGRASALVPAERPAVAEVAVGGASPEVTQATIDLILENDWGTGALFNVAITNRSETPISGWELSLDVPFELAELWSALVVEEGDGRVTVQNAAWNGEIAPGATVSFGFIADAGDIALGRLLSRADIELAIE